MRQKTITCITFSLALSMVVATTATRADTPFFWDDFDREVLRDGNVHWRVNVGEAYLDDESLILQPIDATEGPSHADVSTTVPSVGDFTIRAQIFFGGVPAPGGQQWLGPWSSQGWGGMTPDGWISVGANTLHDSAHIFEPDEIYGNDIHVQYEYIGEVVAVRAWLDGTEKPTEPQVTMEREIPDTTAYGIHYNPIGAPSDEFGTIRYFAVLPAVSGDFSADDALDLEDIVMIDQELRGESTNRVFDLNEDARVTGEDRQLLIKDLIGTWYGDSNLDGEFNTADLLAVLQSGEYEDAIQGNSSWATGDWNGNGDFDKADLVLALQDGGFEQGSLAAVSSVPEPGAGALLAIGLIGLLASTRGRRSIKLFS